MSAKHADCAAEVHQRPNTLKGCSSCLSSFFRELPGPVIPVSLPARCSSTTAMQLTAILSLQSWFLAWRPLPCLRATTFTGPMWSELSTALPWGLKVHVHGIDWFPCAQDLVAPQNYNAASYQRKVGSSRFWYHIQTIRISISFC